MPRRACYTPPIPAFVAGFSGRYAATHRGWKVTPSVVAFLETDFAWFAKRFATDPRVSPEATAAFRDIFVLGPVPVESARAARDPAPSRQPALGCVDRVADGGTDDEDEDE